MLRAVYGESWARLAEMSSWAYSKTMPAETTSQFSKDDSSQIKRQIFRSLEAKSLRSRPLATRIADTLTNRTSTPTFLFLNALIFIVWISYNSGMLPSAVPFDPYPFGFLTMAVSLEAIFLSIFVLVSQNRAAQIATLRDELNLRINLIAEQEITKILKMQADLHRKLKVPDYDDAELLRMIKDIDTNSLEQSILKELNRADEPIFRSITKQEFPELIKHLTGGKKKK